MAGVWITSNRAGSALVFPKVCTVPRGTSTNPSRPTVSSSPSTMIETRPSSTKYASEQFVCRRAGGRRAAGRQRALHQRQSPPSSPAVALKNISLPRAE
jgi:hypothetical protein